MVGLIPGGDVLNVFTKIKEEIAVAAPLADKLAEFILGLIGSEYDSVFGILCAHYFGDHEGEKSYDPNKLSKEQLDSMLPVTKTVIEIASNMYEGVAKKFEEEGNEAAAKQYLAKANKAKNINAAEKTKQVILSKEKHSLERIKQIENSAIQTIKNQASNKLNMLISSYLKNLSESDKSAILSKSISEFKSLN